MTIIITLPDGSIVRRKPLPGERFELGDEAAKAAAELIIAFRKLKREGR